MTNLDSVLKSRDITLPKKGPSHQGYGFSRGHIWMWELDYKESWVPNNWCFWTMMLEKTLESPLDCKRIQQVHPKGDQSWVFIGRTNVEAETPILWPSDVKSWLIWKDPDAGKDWEPKEKRAAEDAMVDSITDSLDMNLGKFWKLMRDSESWHSAVHGSQRVRYDWLTEQPCMYVCVYLCVVEYTLCDAVL